MDAYPPTLIGIPETVIEIVAYATAAMPDAHLVYIQPDAQWFLVHVGGASI